MDYREIEQIIRKAGAMMLEGSHHLSSSQIHQKQGPANFVTDFDMAIQKYLIDSFRNIVPEASFYGEEQTDGNTCRIEDGYTFVIDPIDGTTNYLYGYDHSCVSVGISLNKTIVAGFVYNPFRDEMYSSVKGQGSFLNQRKLKIGNRSLSEGIAAFGSALYNCDQTEIQFEVIKELFLKSIAIRNGGSAALDLCRIASGANVAYFEILLQPYDYAAASIIIEEAGGGICQPDGSPISLERPCLVIAGTEKAAKEIREIVKKAFSNHTIFGVVNH